MVRKTYVSFTNCLYSFLDFCLVYISFLVTYTNILSHIATPALILVKSCIIDLVEKATNHISNPSELSLIGCSEGMIYVGGVVEERPRDTYRQRMFLC